MERDLSKRPLGYDDPESFFEFVKGKKIKWSEWEGDGYFIADKMNNGNLIGEFYPTKGEPFVLVSDIYNGFELLELGYYWELVDPIDSQNSKGGQNHTDEKTFVCHVVFIQAKPLKTYPQALNVYIKDQLACISFLEDGKKKVHKYPLSNIFRIEQDC